MKIIKDENIILKKRSKFIYTLVYKSEDGMYGILIAGLNKTFFKHLLGNEERNLNIALELQRFIFDRFEILKSENKFIEFLNSLSKFKRANELLLNIITGTATYTEHEVYEIIDSLDFSLTFCENEKSGEDKNGWLTIQISQENEGDYFGEFVGQIGKPNFKYIHYK